MTNKLNKGNEIEHLLSLQFFSRDGARRRFWRKLARGGAPSAAFPAVSAKPAHFFA